MIRTTRVADNLVTVDEFFRLIPDGQKADLIDGVIHVASPDSPDANRLNVFIAYLMLNFIDEKELGGDVFVNRVAFQLSDIRAPEPDVAYMSEDRLPPAGSGRISGGPDIVVEIVAKESRSRDYGEKRAIYEQAGVSEYWIIDPLQKRTEFLRLRDGHFDAVPLEGGRFFLSEALPGFWLDVEWLFTTPRPRRSHCCRLILAGPPTP